MSQSAAWKHAERRVAKYLGLKRTGHLGGSDCSGGWMAGEVKYKRQLPAWLIDAVDQARRHAGDEQLPFVVALQHRMPVRDGLFIARLSDIVQWIGDARTDIELKGTDHETE